MQDSTRRFIRVLRERSPGPWKQGFEQSWDVWDDSGHCIANCGPKRDFSYGMTSSMLNSRFIAVTGTCGNLLADLIEAVEELFISSEFTPSLSERRLAEAYKALTDALEKQ